VTDPIRFVSEPRVNVRATVGFWLGFIAFLALCSLWIVGLVVVVEWLV
jgi:hypothetical protein